MPSSEPDKLDLARSMVQQAVARGIAARLMGGLAIWERCPSVRTAPLRPAARNSDIDFVVASSDRRSFEKMLRDDFSLQPDPWLAAIPTEIHARFYKDHGQSIEKVCDVTYDRIEACHTIDLRGRLAVDENGATIPLAELLLSKLQIVDPAQKDVFDTIAILLDHEFGDGDGDTINLPVLQGRCARDWGLEHTMRASAFRVGREVAEFEGLDCPSRVRVLRRLIDLLSALQLDAKRLCWRLRALAGRDLKWYRTPQFYPDPSLEELRRVE